MNGEAGQPPFVPLQLRPVSPRRTWFVTWAVRLSRVAIVAAAAWVIAVAQERAAAERQPAAVTLSAARQIFPTATRLGTVDRASGRAAVYGDDGEHLGDILTTSPETDDVIGYTSPSNVLVGLNPDGAIQGAALLSSGDTAAHVDAIRADTAFWTQFVGRKAGGSMGDVDAVSGSTLTSLGIAASLQQRLSGSAVSLKFPDPVSLQEIQEFYCDATSFEVGEPLPGWYAARDQQRQLLGYVVQTSPAADSVLGYAGPTNVLFSVDRDQQTIRQVRLRSSYDTPDYVERVREDLSFLDPLIGQTLHQVRDLDFRAAGIEGVSGATQTSYAVAAGVQRRATTDLEHRAAERDRTSRFWQQVALGSFLAGSLWLTFGRRSKDRRVRGIWQLAVIGGLGLWLGDLLSISLLAGWFRAGNVTAIAPLLGVLTAISLIIPWGTKQQIYCHQLCPHGAAQEWLGAPRRWQWHLPAGWNGWLSVVPPVLLLVAFGLAVGVPSFDLARIEPFDGWSLKLGAPVSLSIAVVSLMVSVFVPQSYCRFGCPTGALLKFVRSHGRAERFGRQEFVGAAAVLVAAIWFYWPQKNAEPNAASALPSAVVAPTGSSPSRLEGTAFGTTWSIELRQPLDDAGRVSALVQAELDRIETRLSHWRPESETSQFNSSDTTFEIEVSPELIALTTFARQLSEATAGSYDITVGPLANAWGFGPSGAVEHAPFEASLKELLAATGWQKLHIDTEFSSLRKDDPRLQLDLGSLLQGHACDCVAQLLDTEQISEYLIDIGSEFRCRGTWKVAIENPRGDGGYLATVQLTDAALATSGVYRTQPGGDAVLRHLISPRTGQPIESTAVLCTVIAPTGLAADGWATALLASPAPEALQIAEEHGVAALVADRHGDIRRSAKMSAETLVLDR